MRVLKVVSLCFVALGAMSAHADSWCDYSRQLDAEMDLRGIDGIEVLAVSGDLTVNGAAGHDRVYATGRACVEKQYRERLSEFSIIEERAGSVLRIIAFVPYRDDSEDWRVGGLDLNLTVPEGMPLKITDSSGDIEIENVQALDLSDSSGDIRLKNIRGNTLITSDSSGDIEIVDAGDVEIRVDSSGDIDVRRAASVLVGKDSSGSIEARQIRGDVTVGADSSGDVSVSDIGGNFTVERDGSGDIRYSRVAGTVQIPDY